MRAGQAVGRIRLQWADPRGTGRRQPGHRDPSAAPGFTSSARPLYGVVEGAKPLPPNTRLSFRTVSCGTDGVVTSCLNSINQSGFVLSPAGSYTFG